MTVKPSLKSPKSVQDLVITDRTLYFREVLGYEIFQKVHFTD